MRFYKLLLIANFIFFISNTSFCQSWKDYADSAVYYSKHDQAGKAIEFYRMEKRELSHDSLATDTYVNVCVELGYLLHKNKMDTAAESCYKEAIDISQNNLKKQNAGYQGACYNLGGFYDDMRQYDKVEPLWLEVKTLMKATGPVRRYATFCNVFGSFYTRTEQLEKACTLLREANDLQATQFGKNDFDYGKSCYSLGDLYFKKGQFDTAQSYYQVARQIFGNVDKYRRDYANCLLKIGILNRMNGDNDKAKVQLETALNNYSKLSTTNQDYAACCNALAIVYKNAGDFEKAEELSFKANDILRKQFGESGQAYALSCNNLGNFFKNIGQFNKAKEWLSLSARLYEKAGTENADYANACCNLANVYQQTGDTGNAKLYFDKAIQTNEKNVGKQHPDYALSCVGLGTFYLKQCDYDKSEQYYLEAEKIQKGGGSLNPNYANTCNGLGVVYERKEDFNKAEAYYRKAKMIRETVLGKLHPYYGATCNNLANLYWRKGENAKADEAFKEAFDVAVHNLNATFRFTNEKEKRDFVKNILGEDDKAYSFYYLKRKESGQPYNISLFHRNLILSSLQNMKAELSGIADTGLLSKYYQWIDLRKQLSVFYTSVDAQNSKEDIPGIAMKADSLEKELNRAVVAFQKRRTTWNEIRDKLQPGEAAIEFASFHFNLNSGIQQQVSDSVIYVAIVLKPGAGLPEMISLCNEKELIAVLCDTTYKKQEDFINQLYGFHKNVVDPKKISRRSIYELTWKPLEAILKDVKTVYFAPAGMLHRVAIAAIPVNEKEILADRYNLVQLLSTEAVKDQAETAINTSDTLRLYGGIDYDADSTSMAKVITFDFIKIRKAATRSLPGDLNQFVEKWDYLDDANAEVTGIKGLDKYPNRVINLTGASACEESVKALDGTASPAVLHIASHGFFFPKNKPGVKDIDSSAVARGNVFKDSDDPLLRSGLLFAGANNKWVGVPVAGIEDGILTSYEIANLYLPNTKLAVLSACETALGEIEGSEGVYGLQRAFKIAGVQNLIMSLWKVPGNETAEFMQEFYKNIFDNISISKSFHAAQIMMKNKYKDDPYKWAAWILIR